MATKLYVGGLSYSARSEDLRTLFSQVGQVESAVVVIDKKTGRTQGFGFVEMATREAAEAAIQRFNGHVFGGQPLTVQPAHSPGAAPARGVGRKGEGRRGRGPRQPKPRW